MKLKRLRELGIVVREERTPCLAEAVRNATRRARFTFEMLRVTKGLLSPYVDATTRHRVRYVRLEVLAKALGTTADAIIVEAHALATEQRVAPVPKRRAGQCQDCESTGWLHMNDSMGRGPGLERCDTCERFESDEDAKTAHDLACRCGLVVAPREGTEHGED